MRNDSYTLSTNDVITEEAIINLRSRNKVLHDFENEHILNLSALVASGDYLAVLATKLDEIAQDLEKSNPEMYIQIDHLVADLLYLHEKCTVAKREHVKK